MTPERWLEVDNYLAGLFCPPDDALEEALRASAEAGLPQIAVAPVQGKLLQLLARACGAKRILEIGTLGGYSTIWLARALAPGGHLTTLEAVPKHASVAIENLERAGLSDRVDVIQGNAADLLPSLKGPFDFIFIDADKQGYPEYLTWSLRLSRVGTMIVADNVVRGGAVLDGASGDPVVDGVRRFNALVASEPRLQATAIQTVGAKGYDGLLIALVAS